MAFNVGEAIADRKQMSVRELREKHEAVSGGPTLAGDKPWLFKRSAWRLQSRAEGELWERPAAAAPRRLCPRRGRNGTIPAQLETTA